MAILTMSRAISVMIPGRPTRLLYDYLIMTCALFWQTAGVGYPGFANSNRADTCPMAFSSSRPKTRPMSI